MPNEPWMNCPTDLLIGRQLCSSWSVLAYVHFTASRRSARVLGRPGWQDAQYSSTPSCPAPPNRGVSWERKGFQNVAAPLYMFEALGGYGIEERLPLPKTKTTRKRGIISTAIPVAWTCLRHTFFDGIDNNVSGMPRVNVLWETTREESTYPGYPISNDRPGRVVAFDTDG